MPEVGGQPGQQSFRVEPGPIPAEQRPDGKGMPKVVDTGRARLPSSHTCGATARRKV